MSNVVFLDFDSTVVTKESLDEVLAYALSDNPNKGRLVRDIEAITNRGMNGEIPFTESAQLRLATLPLTRSHFEHVGQWLLQHVTHGMPELFSYLHAHNVHTYIISGGFYESIVPVADALHVSLDHVFTNRCVYDAAGTVTAPDNTSLLWTNNGKAPVIQHILAQYQSPTSALIGDGSNDLAAYTKGVVQHFCGFGANAVRSKVQAQSPAFVRSTADAQTWLAQVLGL